MTILPGSSSEAPERPVAVAPESRVITIRPTTVLAVLGIAVLVGLTMILLYLAWQVLTWILVAVILACALNPAVEAFERRGLRRGYAAGIVFGLALLVMAGVGFLIVPPLAAQVSDFIETVPDFIDDLTRGRGPLGWLQDDYQIVDRIREAIEAQGAGGVLGLSLPVLDLVRSVVTAVVAVITIIFLTFFMLLEGPRTIQGALSLLAPQTRVRYERVGYDIYKTISGYVTGNLMISLIAGVTSTVVLFGVGSDFAIALGLLVAILDLIPLAGATIAAILVSTVVLIETNWVRGLIVIGFFLAYQQFENHVLQPLVYGRTVQLSPLAVLLAVLVGAQLAGVLGALMAIPVAGTLLAIGRELLHYRREAAIQTPPGVDLNIDRAVSEES
ncbi:MAG: AI-2E family transporter [Actinomycetota bacterium]|nr:AI-2E family transporter [Actinomycetota bacterium]